MNIKGKLIANLCLFCLRNIFKGDLKFASFYAAIKVHLDYILWYWYLVYLFFF